MNETSLSFYSRMLQTISLSYTSRSARFKDQRPARPALYWPCSSQNETMSSFNSCTKLLQPVRSGAGRRIQEM